VADDWQTWFGYVPALVLLPSLLPSDLMGVLGDARRIWVHLFPQSESKEKQKEGKELRHTQMLKQVRTTSWNKICYRYVLDG
jgi:hypothetical protein